MRRVLIVYQCLKLNVVSRKKIHSKLLAMQFVFWENQYDRKILQM